MHRDPVAQCALRALERRSMSVTDLAKETRLPRTSLALWLAGKRSISTLKASRVMEALGLSITDDHDGTTKMARGNGAPGPPGPAG